MCGIAGFSGSVDTNKLDKMLERLIHRGPDDIGRAEKEGFSLGIRRLEIVDFSGGRQPFWSKDRSIALVFNGEIYNHKELRIYLENLGCSFNSNHSDTEVILRLYENFGINFIDKLVGMFAIAIADYGKEELHLIRDRIGERPIYYSWDRDARIFEFASEFNALHSESNDLTINGKSLRWFFGMKTMPDDSTISNNISRIPIGSRLVLKKGESPVVIKYHRINSKSPLRNIRLIDAIEKLEHLLKATIQLQLDADATVGAFLSGGLDSSLVVSIASQSLKQPLKTYCLVYEEDIFNKAADQKFSRIVADSVGSLHEEVLLTPSILAEDLPKIIRHYGQPNSATMASWFVCKAMKGNVKVALTGDGADELFGSYFIHRVMAALQRARDSNSIHPLETLPSYEKAFAEQHWKSSLTQIYEAFSVFSGKEQEKLLSKNVDGCNFSHILHKSAQSVKAKDLLSQSLEYDFSHLLPEQILNYGDVLAMAHSIELRMPFLDHRIVDWVFSLPHEFKIHNGETKYLLKCLAERWLPSELIYRKKEGFIEPNIYWINGPLKEFAKDYLLGKDFNISNLLQKNYANMLINNFFDSGEFYLGKKVWSLLMFAIWEKEYFKTEIAFKET